MAQGGIDFVILWVDGGDKEWQQIKRSYQPGIHADDGESRYREWEQLRYWFRGVERFAPWVRKIHFVTCGQKPDWLDVSHPKLHYVTHDQFMDEAYLPSFSSHSIELNIHRIPGLSEQFVYFNDDMFLTAPVEEADFFRGGLPCDCAGYEVINPHYDQVFYQTMINQTRVINEHFDAGEFLAQNRSKIYRFGNGWKYLLKSVLLYPWAKGFIPGFVNPHLPNAYLKTSFEKVWAAEPELLHQTCLHKFRCTEDVNQYIMQYWQFMEGKFIPINRSRQGHFFYAQQNHEACCRAIRSQKYKLICVNDDVPDTDEAAFQALKQSINGAFDSLLHEKSSFEL